MKTFIQILIEAKMKLPSDVKFLKKDTIESKNFKVSVDDEWSGAAFYIGQESRGKKAWYIVFRSYDLGTESMQKSYSSEEEARKEFNSLGKQMTWDEVFSKWYRKK